MAKSDYGKPARVGWTRYYENKFKHIFNKRKCVICDGSGHLLWFNENNEPMGEEICDACNGTGYVKKELE